MCTRTNKTGTPVKYCSIVLLVVKKFTGYIFKVMVIRVG